MKKLFTILALLAATLTFASAQEYGVQWTRHVNHITTATTTHVATSQVVLHTIVFNVTGSPTSEVVTIQTVETTPKILYKSAALSTATTTPVVVALPIGIVSTGGIDIVTSGTVNTGVLDVWLSYR